MLWLFALGASNGDQREKLTVTFSISLQFTLQIICLFFQTVHDNKSHCNGLISVHCSRNSHALDFFSRSRNKIERDSKCDDYLGSAFSPLLEKYKLS